MLCLSSREKAFLDARAKADDGVITVRGRRLLSKHTGGFLSLLMRLEKLPDTEKPHPERRRFYCRNKYLSASEFSPETDLKGVRQ